jgi:signal peptidase I
VATKLEAAQSQTQLFDTLPDEEGQPQPFPLGREETDVAVALRQKGWAFLKVSGKSMFPWIREGDIVFLRQVAIAEVARGDVVVFTKNGMLCVHRVLFLKTRSSEGRPTPVLITKGDATADLDDAVLADQFRGKIEFIYRRNREIRLAQGWRKYLGKFLAFISPIARWLKPTASALNHQTARCEPLGVPHVEARRTSESSAD